MDEKQKPTIEELEKAIGTLTEPNILPDGSVQPKGHPRIPEDVDFKEACFTIRGFLEAAGISILQLKKRVPQPPDIREAATGEMFANIMLAYRHLEDARMRLGKAIQAYDDGESCYPR